MTNSKWRPFFKNKTLKNTTKQILEKLMKNTGKMGKILERFMKKYWKNVTNTGKVREICHSEKVGTMITEIMFSCHRTARKILSTTCEMPTVISAK